MEDVLVAVPDCAAICPLALFDDLLHRRQRRGEVGDRGQLPARVAERPSRDLSSRVTAEYLLLTELGAEVAQALFDRVVELPDRLVVVSLCPGVGQRRLFETKEHLQGIGTEREERQLHGAVAVGQGAWVDRQHVGCVQDGLTTDRVQEVRRQREVQHLLDEDPADSLDGVRVPLRIQRVEGTEVGRQRRVFQFDRPLKMLTQTFERRDRCLGRRLFDIELW
ncbi:hypothetical protein MBT84_01575 [Streptomyces sp. MBT84]|nr:hypothetical protein [Streptomyces sp. MBT84]